MIAHARIAASGDRLVALRSEPPLALRPTADGVYLVGAAAGPLGGDELTIDIDVTDGAELTVRSSAASVVLPGVTPSLITIRARVEDGCSLRWIPEQTVLACGCRHRVVTRVDLDGDARLEWWEELVLGRHGEPSGSAMTTLRIDLDGAPLLRHELAVGPDHPEWSSPAVLGVGARAVGSVAVVGPGLPTRPAVLGGTAAVLPLDGPAALVTAVAADALSLRRSLACGVDAQVASVAVH